MRLVPTEEEERSQEFGGSPPKPALIRSTHPHAFKSGEWGRIIGVTNPTGTGPCYEVEFIDGKTDSWLMSDAAAGYEFK